jgi:hypothetical protein
MVADAQFAFDFGDKVTPPAPCLTQRDELTDLLVSTGLIGSEYLLDLNRILENRTPEKLPSRLFQFPIEFVSQSRTNGQSKLLLNHPLLAEHPFVQEVAKKTGVNPVWEPHDEFGRDRGAQPRWWHAIDLMTKKHWRGLLETRQYTDSWEIAQAVALALGWNAITVEIARDILTEINAEEPADRSLPALLGDGIYPCHRVEKHPTSEKVKSESWSINVWLKGAEAAWLVIHGMEDGWFKRGKDGYLQMSAEGLRRRDLQSEASD